MARAAQHGLVVCKPWGEVNRYDFVVEHGGKFHRVQVKSTGCISRGLNFGSGAYVCHMGTFSRKNRGVFFPYTPNEIDFFALYVIPEDIWYIMPIHRKLAKCAALLNPHQRSNKYFKYMEAWHLLKSGK